MAMILLLMLRLGNKSRAIEVLVMKHVRFTSFQGGDY